MPERVIGVLEVIDVQEHHRKRPRVWLGRANRIMESLTEEQPVGKLRRDIEMRQALELGRARRGLGREALVLEGHGDQPREALKQPHLLHAVMLLTGAAQAERRDHPPIPLDRHGKRKAHAGAHLHRARGIGRAAKLDGAGLKRAADHTNRDREGPSFDLIGIADSVEDAHGLRRLGHDERRRVRRDHPP